MLDDLTCCIYLLIMIFSAYGTGLFLWWLVKSNFKASAVFLYTLLWIFGTGLSAAVTFYGRSLALVDHTAFLNFTMSFWWPGRLLPALIVLVFLSVHMTVRIFKGKDSGRRLEDG